MSEEIVEVAEQQETEVDKVDYKSMYEEAQKSIEALSAKKDELLKETKQAKEEKRRQAELAEQAKKQQLEVAEKNGEFEKLWKQAQEEKETIQNELLNSRKERRDEKINLAAMKVAVDLAKGDPNKAELLSDFLARSIGKVANEFGQVDDEVLSSVRKQYETDSKYSPLLGGNKSVGSGAQGNTRSASVNNTLTRADFNALSLEKRTEFMGKVAKGNAQLVD